MTIISCSCAVRVVIHFTVLHINVQVLFVFMSVSTIYSLFDRSRQPFSLDVGSAIMLQPLVLISTE